MKDNNEETFGDRVYRLRSERDLSQTQLAKKIGASHGTIQNYEKNMFPKGEYAIKLAEVFECSIDWLLTGKTKSIFDQKNDNTTTQQNSTQDIQRIVADHHDLIDEFIDKSTGKEFNSILLKLEKKSSKEYYSLLGYAKRVLAELDRQKHPNESRGNIQPSEGSLKAEKKTT